jgi:phosphoserine phosphatase RsbU/P
MNGNSGLSAADRERFDQIRTLTGISRALTYARTIDEVLRLVVERAADVVDADGAILMLRDEDALLRVRAAHGIDADRADRFREPLDESLVQRLAGVFDFTPDASFLSVPLVVQGAVTGLLVAVRPGDRPARDSDEWVLSALADQAAVALEYARLDEAVRAERAERVRSVEKVVEDRDRTHATLSHELRSPLTAILSYSSLLLEEMFGPLTDRQRESLARIRMSGHHLLAIIENVLDMARLSAGAIKLSAADVPVSEIVAEAIHMVQPPAAEKEQRLEVLPVPELTTRADANRLRQALVNVLGNAIRYTPARGSIQVRVRRAERGGSAFATLAVTDTGPGIAGEDLTAIFEPYHRGPQVRTDQGLGLGLSISRELIRQMGGDIEVESELGAGTTFTLYVPLAPDPPPASSP